MAVTQQHCIRTSVTTPSYCRCSIVYNQYYQSSMLNHLVLRSKFSRVCNLSSYFFCTRFLTFYVPMSGIYDMTSWSLRTAITPDTVKIMKEFRHFRVRAWNFQQNGIQNFVFWLIHSWGIALQSQIFDIKKKAQKKALALKGLNGFTQRKFFYLIHRK